MFGSRLCGALVCLLICECSSALSLSSSMPGHHGLNSLTYKTSSDRDPRTCGNWQGAYEQFDRAVKEGRENPRYTIVAYPSMGKMHAYSYWLHYCSATEQYSLQLLCVLLQVSAMHSKINCFGGLMM